jgi:hypothetical protein
VGSTFFPQAIQTREEIDMSKRIVFPALIAAFALVASPAAAQNPNQPPPVKGANQPIFQVAPNAGAQMTLPAEDALKKDLATAKKKVADLTKALEDCQKTRDAAQAKANVRMFCADHVTSKNSLGATERCAPYVCSAVSGLCVKRCGGTDDCASGFVCDNSIGVCVNSH